MLGEILTPEQARAVDPPATSEEEAAFQADLEAIREAERQAFEEQ